LTNLWAVILGVSVSSMPRSPSLRSLFLAWVCFCLGFNTVFQTFLTTFLTESGYKTPIRNMDELLDSGTGLAYPEFYNVIFEQLDRTESLKFQRNHVNCQSFEVCFAWAEYHKNVSFLLMDKVAELSLATGGYLSENYEPLLCPLDDGVMLALASQ